MANYCVPDKGKAALLCISAQRDFITPGSPLRASGTRSALPNMKRLVEAFRAQGAPIFHSVRLYKADGSNVDACRRQAVEEGMRILMPGTLGAELIDDLQPSADMRLDPELLFSGEFQEVAGNEFVHYRPRWGAFHDTALEAKLREQEVTTLVICGFSFSTGGRASVYEASARDFRIILATDALCNATEDSVRELGRIGVYLMDSANCLSWMGSGGPRSVAA
ncbi:cysteine hydrolase [Pelagibius litoralis]|uniref:Cysteine hydrolase n=1 Tax=Pelagibius litoralis TaxID=374515 RepID=A0A967KBD4_9PROT|nr:isochorismatase family cysteine hydrolase [Pelagibius litoralis]NIA72118.1 cysteine hydrolase [Pelagibius litoralis]